MSLFPNKRVGLVVGQASFHDLASSSGRSGQEAEKSQTDDSETALGRYNFGVSLLKEGKQLEAMAAFQAAIRLNPSMPEAHFALGVIWMRRGDTTAAKKEFLRVQELDPQFVESYNNLGALLAKEKEYSGAVGQFLEALRLNPKLVEPRINLSKILDRYGNAEAAADQLQTATRWAPSNADLYLSLGEVQYRLERYQDAIRSFRRALQLNPRLAGAHKGLALALWDADRTRLSEVKWQFDKCLKQDPRDPEIHYCLGKLALYENELTSARTYLEEAVRLEPKKADAWTELGKLYQKQGKLGEAERALRTAISLKSDMTQAIYILANLLRAQGNLDEAATLLKQVNELNQRYQKKSLVPALIEEALKLEEEGSLDGAISTLRKAAELDPSSAVVFYDLGIALMRQNRPQEAVAAYRTALQLRPWFALAQKALAVTLKAIGDPSAEEEMHKAEFLMSSALPQFGLGESEGLLQK
jgi:Flp pilus assembly protein TadD